MVEVAAAETLIRDQETLVELVVLVVAPTDIIHHLDQDLLELEILHLHHHHKVILVVLLLSMVPVVAAVALVRQVKIQQAAPILDLLVKVEMDYWFLSLEFRLIMLVAAVVVLLNLVETKED